MSFSPGLSIDPVLDSLILPHHSDASSAPTEKKGAQLSPLSTTLLAPDPEDPTSMTLELDERMARLCETLPTTPGCGWPCAERAGKWSPIRLGLEPARQVSGCERPFQRDIAEGVLNLLLGILRAGDPQGAAYCRGKRDGRNRPCPAVEEHPSKAAGSFCAHDVLIFQGGADA
jgi:hypothetical protein